MRKTVPVRAYLVCALCIAASVAAASHFDTGDKDMDAKLEQLNREFKSDPQGFSRKASAEFGVEQARIEAAMQNHEMEPAEVYLALELASISGRPLETVLNIYNNHTKNGGKGWGVVAQALGIKPGSDSFKQLKASVVTKPEKKEEYPNTKAKAGKADISDTKIPDTKVPDTKVDGTKSAESRTDAHKGVEASKAGDKGKEKGNNRGKK